MCDDGKERFAGDAGLARLKNALWRMQNAAGNDEEKLAADAEDMAMLMAALEEMKRDGLVEEVRPGHWSLTEKGRRTPETEG